MRVGCGLTGAALPSQTQRPSCRYLALAKANAGADLKTQLKPSMPDLSVADALRLAINVLRDASESRRMPSGIELGQATADLHADAAEILEASLAEMQDFE